MNPIIIIVLIILILSPLLALHLIKPDGNYHCMVPGCIDSFTDLNNFIGHLKSEHDYTCEEIEEVLRNIRKYR